MNGHLEGDLPQLGDLLTMGINSWLNGMILQVPPPWWGIVARQTWEWEVAQNLNTPCISELMKEHPKSHSFSNLMEKRNNHK